MGRILGLDLGTNSVGWAIVETNRESVTLIDKGVRIFSEGVKTEKGVESSRASERTGFRSARKIKFRRKLRKYETLKVLSRNDMCPLSLGEIEKWKKSGFKEYPLNPDFLKWLRTSDDTGINPYFFRDQASRKKISMLELGRAFYHIAQRRGFLSNRLDQSADGIIEQHKPNLENILEEVSNIAELKIEIDNYFEGLDTLEKSSKDLDEGEKELKKLYNSLEKVIKANSANFDKVKSDIAERLNRKEDLGAVKQSISDITDKMRKGGFVTIGQYFNSIYNQEIVIVDPESKKTEKFNRAKIRNAYTGREEHYLEEFELICKMQGIEKINEDELVPERRYEGLAKDLHRAMFFQRPLKSQKNSVSKCSFEKGKTRCPLSHPDFEEYRMWCYLNSIKIKTPTDSTLRFLTSAEKTKLIPKFFRKSKENFDFGELANELVPSGAKFDFYKSKYAVEVRYLFNYKKNDTVAGCPVSAALKLALGDDWKTRVFSYETKHSSGRIVSHSLGYKDIWHLLSVATSDTYLLEYAQSKLNLEPSKAKVFSKIRLKKDYANLSLTAINKILPYLREGLLYSHAVFIANLHNIVDEIIWKDEAERTKIQNTISDIIAKNTLENDLVECINGLIKHNKENGYMYSKEAESAYHLDLKNRLEKLLKTYNSEIDFDHILKRQFAVFVEQMQRNSGQGEFLRQKRLDEKVIDFLRGNNESGQIFCSDETKLKKLYHPSDIEIFRKAVLTDIHGNETIALGSPLIASIKNPMAMRALHQLRKVVNTLILEGQISPKTKVHIELARELNDANRRKAIQDFQNENKNNRKDYAKEIKELYFAECQKEIEPTEDDLLRYQLWIEQKRREIYEDGNSISICDIIGANPKYDIEHTVPRSFSQDNSLMNKTLASQRFNREIKKEKMPVELSNHDAILLRIDHWRIEAEKLSFEINQISRSIKAAATKELKDKKIRRRHYLTLKRDYIKGKYDRFIWTEPRAGFKNSQIPDTGIITKYSRAFLKSYFARVDSVKGGMVAEFRKIWGLQESFMDEQNQKQYKPKDRSKHTHHAIDAITIACMTKDKYDVVAHAWTLEDQNKKVEARKIIEEAKPWKTFTQEVRQIEQEILVSHYTPDVVKKETKKILRLKGKKQYVAEIEYDSNGKAIPKKNSQNKIIYKFNENGHKIPRFKQGDSIRGSLHKAGIYGAIQDPLNPEELKYVIRKDLESLKANDIENIVDEAVKDKIKQAIDTKILILSANPQQKNKVPGTIWMNEEKRVPIKKVRVIANGVKNPLEIKEHAPLSKSRKSYKQMVYSENDDNYCMVIYDDGTNKDFELINNFVLAKSMKEGTNFYPLQKEKVLKKKTTLIPIARRNKRDIVLKKGQLVVFYDKKIESPETIIDLVNLKDRLYIIEGLSISRIVRPTGKTDEYGMITLRFHHEARKAEELKKEAYKPDGEYKTGEFKPTRRMSHVQFTAFVENVDFRISPTGKIYPI